jgi:hypothetical protein
MLTLPAVALNDLVVYSSWPSRLVSRLREVPAPAAGAVLEVVVELGVLAVVAGAAGVLGEELLLEELPQPARAIRTRASAAATMLRAGLLFGVACESVVTVWFLRSLGSVESATLSRHLYAEAPDPDELAAGGWLLDAARHRFLPGVQGSVWITTSARSAIR